MDPMFFRVSRTGEPERNLTYTRIRPHTRNHMFFSDDVIYLFGFLNTVFMPTLPAGVVEPMIHVRLCKTTTLSLLLFNVTTMIITIITLMIILVIIT